MSIFSNNKFLIAIIVILIATNISTILTVRYKSAHKVRSYQENRGGNIKLPTSRFGMFFREQLNLNEEQHAQFREFRQQYHPHVHGLTNNMREKRMELLTELSKEHPDTLILNNISKEIGDMHTMLKIATNEYFLNMKSVCTPEQQTKLTEIFRTMLNKESRPEMRGNRVDKGRQRKQRREQ
jgi:Spy/CpxP family protein refolding chaperone